MRTQRGVRMMAASIHRRPAAAHFLMSHPGVKRGSLVKHNDVQDVIDD
jgi:hypothetical protein